MINIRVIRNGAYLASVSTDKTVCIWSTTTGLLEARFNGHRWFMGGIITNTTNFELSGISELFFALGNKFKMMFSFVDIPLCVAFTSNNTLLASANGGFNSYTVFIYDRQGKQQQKLVNFDGPAAVPCLSFSSSGECLAVLKVCFLLQPQIELHLWNWKTVQCVQQIVIPVGISKPDQMIWFRNSIRILFSEQNQCLTYYKGKKDTFYRLSSVVGKISTNIKKLSLQGTRGLTSTQYRLLKAQGAVGKPKAFAHIVDDAQDISDEKKELAFLVRCRKGLNVQVKHQYACPALFEPQKHINTDRWQLILFRITESVPQSTSNTSIMAQACTSKGSTDYHVYGFLEGLDAIGRSVMIQFDLVEDRNYPKYARIKNKCVISESHELTARQQIFMTMFKRERNLPTKLCIQIAGTLNAEQRDNLLDTIIDDQKRQFEPQDLWEERRIRYQQTGGSEQDSNAVVFSANCLTWLRRILRPYKLSLPYSIWDTIAVNPKYILSEGGFFRNTSCKILDISGWEKSVTHTATKSFK